MTTRTTADLSAYHAYTIDAAETGMDGGFQVTRLRLVGTEPPRITRERHIPGPLCLLALLAGSAVIAGLAGIGLACILGIL